MTQYPEFDELKARYRALIKSFPERVPLDMHAVYRRRMHGYEEWKIEYTAEDPDTMPEPAGRRVPAYILVPAGEPPFPAMICFHQCNLDCALGKEAVAGKVVNRPDQVYGFELVQQGFVVLAPDTMNCGERNVPAIRQDGESIFRSSCSSQLEERMGRPWEDKVMFDGVRAVDLLHSLDFVDIGRIGAIGHSLGSGTTLLAMIADERIQAGIVSGLGEHKGIALIAPRLLMQLQGLHEPNASEMIRRIEDTYEFALKIYREEGAGENLILRTLPCGHYFLTSSSGRHTTGSSSILG